MKLKRRSSNSKRARMTGFRYRRKTQGGRSVIRRRRARGRRLMPK
ncbi:MAG: 50S ribosomal protein L34 [Planctomycetota bacterium]